MYRKEFKIETELSSGHLDEALEFIRDYYLFTQPDSYLNVKKTKIDEVNHLSFLAIAADKDKNEKWKIKIDIAALSPFKLEMYSDSTIDSKINDVMERMYEGIFIIIQFFEDMLRQSTLYFAWVEGEDIIPEEPPTGRKKASFRIFGSNMILIYVLFFGINIILFIFLGMYAAVIAILTLQLIIVLLSDKILSITSDWAITPENPRVHILEYQLPLDDFKRFREKFGRGKLVKMKNEIYEKSLAKGLEPTCELGEEVFLKYGFECRAEEKVSKEIDVYKIVKEAAEKFEVPIPKIAISNTMIPNAAATGPSPNMGLVLITTGLLVQLEEDEILAVIGHEMGHLVGRDPIILFSIISGEFILRFTLLLPIVVISPLLYIILALGMVFFIAKFFESRADLLSAMKIGNPSVLAEALRKIGYRRLHAERTSSTRLPSWLTFDPHPPLYFRIDRLEKMETPIKEKNPLLKSIEDVFSGLKRSMGFK